MHAFEQQYIIVYSYFFVSFSIRSHMVITRISGLSIDCVRQAVLRDGALFHVLLERWSVCGYYQCHFGCTVSHKLSVNNFHLT